MSRKQFSLLLVLIAAAACGDRDVQPSVTSSRTLVARRVARVGGFVGLSGASVSPDGRHLVHTDWTTGDLAVRDLRTGQSRRVTNKGPLTQSVEFAEFFMQFSRDGHQLGYIWDRNGYELHVSDVEGSGPSRFIYRNPPGQGEVLVYDWSDDGAYFAAVVPRSADSGQLRLVLINASDGSVHGLMDLGDAASPGIREMRGARMSFSPDSRFLAYDLPTALSTKDIFVIGLESDEKIIAVQHPADDRLLDWTPDGRALLFWSDREGSPAVWRQPMQGGQPSGSAERLISMEKGARPLGFASDGTYFVAVPEARQHEVFVGSLDLDQGLLSAISAPAGEVPGPRTAPEWSPDGRLLAYLERDTIVIRSLESGEERRRLRPAALTEIFTVGTGERYLRWSPDGRHLLVPQNRTLFRIDVSSGEAAPLVGADQVADRRSRYGRWSPDGKAIFYTRQPGWNDGIAEIVRMDLETEKKEVLHRPTLPGDHYSSLELSPDGRWLAFSGVASAPPPAYEATTLTLVPASGGSARLLLQISGEEWMKVVGWARDSDELLFTRGVKLGGEASTTLWRISVHGGAPRGIDAGVPVLDAVRFHPDGRRIAFSAGRRGSEIQALSGLFPQP